MCSCAATVAKSRRYQPPRPSSLPPVHSAVRKADRIAKSTGRRHQPRGSSPSVEDGIFVITADAGTWSMTICDHRRQRARQSLVLNMLFHAVNLSCASPSRIAGRRCAFDDFAPGLASSPAVGLSNGTIHRRARRDRRRWRSRGNRPDPRRRTAPSIPTADAVHFQAGRG